MTICLVLAVAENGVIGRNGALPWHLPADLRRFKALTWGHTVVMGRRTFEAIGKPLPNRLNVVLTRDPEFRSDGVSVVHSLADALSGADSDEELFVIGGAEVFRQTIARSDRLYRTLVHATIDGDTKFEIADPSEWVLCEEELHQRDDKHAYAFQFSAIQATQQEARVVAATTRA